MVRVLYRFLVWLHPAMFRLQFEEEMLWIFDQAAGTWGTGSLVADASISLGRQWLIGSQMWKWAVAGIAGLVPLIIAFGSFLPWDKALHR
ncbi:MAG TPA: hypothetical protein VFN26_09495 [Candidatus Acidoferrum sp.]|nr:hypothetical protein [Candidatus Acidoferrum sp.]